MSSECQGISPILQSQTSPVGWHHLQQAPPLWTLGCPLSTPCPDSCSISCLPMSPPPKVRLKHSMSTDPCFHSPPPGTEPTAPSNWGLSLPREK